MSKTVYNVTLLELLPENLRNDPDIIAVSQAVDTEFQALARAIKNCLTVADIDNASSEVVDHLATEMDADYYDDSLDLATRRTLVKNAYLVKYQNGTKYAVTQVLKSLYTNPVLKEWFEYSGNAYYFKITIDESISKVDEVLSALEKAKNARSWLEKITFVPGGAESFNLYCGVACHNRVKYTITQETGDYICMPGTILEL